MNDDGSPAQDPVGAAPAPNPGGGSSPGTLPPPPAASAPAPSLAATDRAPAQGRSPVAAAVVAALGFVLVGLSMFGVNWVDAPGFSATYLELAENADAPPGAPFPTRFATWHLSWLGYLLAIVALATAVGMFVSAAGSFRRRHRLAAVAAGVAAVASSLTIAGVFRGSGVDPTFGAWLMPLGYLAVLAAVVVDARRHPA